MTKLDKSRPYGESHGLGAGHRYTQDGKFFDGGGNEIKTSGAVEEVKENPPADAGTDEVTDPVASDGKDVDPDTQPPSSPTNSPPPPEAEPGVGVRADGKPVVIDGGKK